jgi:hypothetical protein
MNETQRADYEANLKPFIQALDFFVGSSTITPSGAISGKYQLFVRTV